MQQSNSEPRPASARFTSVLARKAGPAKPLTGFGLLAALSAALAVLLLACEPGAASPPPTVATSPPPTVATSPPPTVATSPLLDENLIYVVQPGDIGLAEIAARECQDWRLWREIETADRRPFQFRASGDPIIREGQRLRLPLACGPAAPAASSVDGVNREGAAQDRVEGKPPAAETSAAATVGNGNPVSPRWAVAAAAGIGLLLLLLGTLRGGMRGWLGRRRLAALAHARHLAGGLAEAARVLEDVERALDAEHLDATVLLIARTATGYELLLRDGPLSAPMGAAHAPRVARHLGTALRLRSRAGRFSLLSTGFLPPQQSPGEPGPHARWLRCLGRDDSGNAVYGHLAPGQSIMLVGSPSELAAVLPRLTSGLLSAGGEDYRVWADHGGAALMGVGRHGSGSTGEVVAYLAETRRGTEPGGCVVLAPASAEPLGHVTPLTAVGRLHLIVASGRSLLNDCILMALSRARSGHRITLTIPGTDYSYNLSVVALATDTPLRKIAPLPRDGAAPLPLPPPPGDSDVEPGGGSPIQAGAAEQHDSGSTDPVAGPDDSGRSGPVHDGRAEPTGVGIADPGGASSETDGSSSGGADTRRVIAEQDVEDGDHVDGLEFIEDRLLLDIPFGDRAAEPPGSGSESDVAATGDAVQSISRVHVEVLGDIRATAARAGGDRQAFPLRRRLAKALFAILAANEARGIPTDRTELAGLLRGGNERRMGRDLSRARVDIRKAIGAPESDDPLPTSRANVLFPRDYYSSDLQFFLGSTASADTAVAREDAGAALSHLRRALDLVRGEPLRGLRGEWAEATRAELQGEIGRAAARAVGLALELGRPAEIGEFTDAAERAGTTAEWPGELQ